MKTIKEAWLELLSKHKCADVQLLNGFEYGIDFAQKWHDLESYHPEKTNLFNDANFELIRFLVRGSNKKEFVANRKRHSTTTFSFFSAETGRYLSVNEWRLIDIK